MKHSGRQSHLSYLSLTFREIEDAFSQNGIRFTMCQILISAHQQLKMHRIYSLSNQIGIHWLHSLSSIMQETYNLSNLTGKFALFLNQSGTMP
jgi:hypothetical protein